MTKYIIILALMTHGCGGGLALGAGAGSLVRDEIRFRHLEKQVHENNKVIDFLLDELQKNTNN
mgnify:CR=1 FL=1|tara:strand:+ start:257 stop:445 length:189 start_codon:yes stop_codon:yes gene_type:complete